MHTPVLLKEVLEHLQLFEGATVIDATFGRGGYTEAILAQIGSTGTVLALDLDEDAIRHGQEKFAGQRVLFSQTNFSHMAAALEDHGFSHADRIVMDLGVSSPQFDRPERGFSLRSDGPLDMRFGTRDVFDPKYGRRTAQHLLQTYREEELATIFRDFGEERHARMIAHMIVEQRRDHPFTRTVELAEFIKQRVHTRDRHMHPATRVFQALRIAVNDELEHLREALEQSIRVMSDGGRLAVVSFHSLEDRIVKQFGKRESTTCVCPPEFPECRCQHVATLKVVTKKVVTPTFEEVQENPRARSAKLRVYEREKGKGKV